MPKLNKRFLVCTLLAVIFVINIPVFAADKTGAVNMKFETTPNAQPVQVQYFLKQWKGRQRLHFKIGVKNISAEERRFRVRVTVEDNNLIGMLFPRKVKKGGGVKPGEICTQTMPMLFEKIPSSFSIAIEDF